MDKDAMDDLKAMAGEILEIPSIKQRDEHLTYFFPGYAEGFIVERVRNLLDGCINSDVMKLTGNEPKIIGKSSSDSIDEFYNQNPELIKHTKDIFKAVLLHHAKDTLIMIWETGNDKKIEKLELEGVTDKAEYLAMLSKKLDRYEVLHKSIGDKLKELKESETIDKEYLSILSSQLPRDFSGMLTTGRFKKEDGDKWPTYKFGSVNGEAQMKPLEADKAVIPLDKMEILQEFAFDKVMELQKKGHLTADVFDIIMDKWLTVARSPGDRVRISVNDCLKIRGLKPIKRKKGEEYRSGYTDAQRREIASQIETLASIWIKIDEMAVYKEKNFKRMVRGGESRALVLWERYGQRKLDEGLDADSWDISPGTIFSEFLFNDYGRQTALMSVKAVKYDPYRHKWEKSLTRYLAYLWRSDKSETKAKGKEGVKVGTILKRIYQELNVKRPNTTKERLEKALDQLEYDGVITGWEYAEFDEDIVGKQGWGLKWLDWKIMITGIPELMDYYPRSDKYKKQIEKAKKAKEAKKAKKAK